MNGETVRGYYRQFRSEGRGRIQSVIGCFAVRLAVDPLIVEVEGVENE